MAVSDYMSELPLIKWHAKALLPINKAKGNNGVNKKKADVFLGCIKRGIDEDHRKC